MTGTQELPRLYDCRGSRSLKTVEYKGRFLYSKYDPAKATESAIEHLAILPGTLVLVCSPVLWHGYAKLESSMPAGCQVLALEDDENLYQLAQEGAPHGVALFRLDQRNQIDSFVRQLCSTGGIKRSLRVDFSAGVSLAKERYDFTAGAIADVIATFWKNRITLARFGRLFSRNFLKNTANLDSSCLIEDVARSVSKPVVVCGAGESLDEVDFAALVRDEFFIIAVDAALPSLASRGVFPDALVALESQLAIEKSYIGLTHEIKERDIVLIADLCSRNEVAALFLRKVWVATRYSDAQFLDRLRQCGIVQHFAEPMGSVGLLAVAAALVLRSTPDVPVFVCGMDFAFSVGRTHAKGTQAYKRRLFNCTRTNTIEDVASSFAIGAQEVTCKSGATARTTKILSQYAAQFKAMFSGQQNLFDCTSFGQDLGLAHKSICSCHWSTQARSPTLSCVSNATRGDGARQLLLAERESLVRLKDLLARGEASSFRDEGITLDEQITHLASEREYLFLHFPDGFAFKATTSFLHRVRAEIDYFLKQLDIALATNTDRR